MTRKKLTYLQFGDLPKSVTEESARLSVTPSVYKVMPYDILYIRVITPDPRWSEIFNSVPGGSGTTITSESANLLGYPVDDFGFIEIPFVGPVEVAGKTLAEINQTLDTTFKKYLNDAAISVRLVNNHISILGEVRTPGYYPLPKDRINIFEALSLAGDLGDYSDRQRIQLIRPSAYGPVVKEFSLNDRSILTSEFYYVLPNDIIYAKPLSGRSFQMNSNISAIVLGSITTILTIIVLLRSN